MTTFRLADHQFHSALVPRIVSFEIRYKQTQMKIDELTTGKVQAALEEISLEDGSRASAWLQGDTISWQGPDVGECFNAWSCTKSFLSTCCGLIVDDGLIDIDAPATRWLPEFREHYPTVTLRHLLTFTSGLETLDREPFKLLPPKRQPGEAFHYHFDSDWVSLALTRAGGRSLADLFLERIAQPIGMRSGGWFWGNFGTRDGLVVNGGSGALFRGIHIDPLTLLRFGKLMMHRGNWKGRQLISKHWLDQAQTPRPETDRPVADPNGWYRNLPGSYGLHWWCNGIRPDSTRLWPSAPPEAFALQGNLNQMCIVVPEWQTTLVRMGRDGVIPAGDYDQVLKIIGDNL